MKRHTKTRDAMQRENPGKSSTAPLVHDQGTDRFNHLSLVRLFAIIASIFFAEIIAIIVVYFIPPLPYQLVTLIDAGIMVTLISPSFTPHRLVPCFRKLKASGKPSKRCNRRRS